MNQLIIVGDLGAGKTTLTDAITKVLGEHIIVVSPENAKDLKDGIDSLPKNIVEKDLKILKEQDKLHHDYLFIEPKNFINGKKMPRKKHKR